MQHQSDVPVPAPQRSGDPPRGQIHPQIQRRRDGGDRGKWPWYLAPPPGLQKSSGRPLGHPRGGAGLSAGPDESTWPVTPSQRWWWRGAAGACEVRHCSRVGARVGLLFPRSPPRGQCFGLPASRDARALVKSISSTSTDASWLLFVLRP